MAAQSTFLTMAVFALVFAGQGSAQQEGMIPRWEVTALAEDVVKNIATGQKVLSELRPREWLQDGAPDAYVDQLLTLQSDLDSATLSAEALRRHPERLSYAVDTFLWLDRSDSLLSSMASGVRKYYNGAIADLLDSARSRNVANIGTLKEYMGQLAVEVETSMDIANREAQRCRADIAKKPEQP